MTRAPAASVAPGCDGAPGAPGVPPRHRAAVIGWPAAHSLSPVLHEAAYAQLGLADWRYTIRPTRPEELASLLDQMRAPVPDGEPAWEGLSVTMPHKQALVAAADVVDPLASVVGAANTVVAQRSGRGPALLAVFNTDVAGIVGAVREHLDPGARPRRAVVLGSGATACSALAALTELGAQDVTVVARRHSGPGRAVAAAHRMGLEITAVSWRPGQVCGPGSDGEVAERLAGADVVVSTLPAGAGDGLARVLAQAASAGRTVAAGAVLLDVVYAPWPTALAGAWQAAGGRIAPGWLMLLHQATGQVRLMTGREPDVEPMRVALQEAIRRREAGGGVG